ncbi:Uncharacterised protein [Neisseria meningitidis]|nr:Uncharacterised protein [Neisseria meningitidis]
MAFGYEAFDVAVGKGDGEDDFVFYGAAASCEPVAAGLYHCAVGESDNIHAADGLACELRGNGGADFFVQPLDLGGGVGVGAVCFVLEVLRQRARVQRADVDGFAVGLYPKHGFAQGVGGFDAQF